MTIIPIRPKDDVFSSIKDEEKDMLTFSVLWDDMPKEEVFAIYNPSLCSADRILTKDGRKQCNLFFNFQRHKDYMEAYRRTLENAINMSKGMTIPEIDDKRKDKALRSLFDKAMTLVEGQNDLDADTLKIAAEIFKKIGLLKDDVEQVEAPRRYLPVKCLSECQYRVFCEKAIENGEIENECLYCKALKIAQEHGYKYDPKTNLDIPYDIETGKVIKDKER